MRTFLINIPTEQTIDTVEFGPVHCLAYSHPDYYVTRTQLAADFGNIVVGDQLVLCCDSKLKSLAYVAEVRNCTDLAQRSVRILQGPIRARFANVAVGAAVKRAKARGLPVPRLIYSALSGFKQNAFCEEVPGGLVEELKQSWL
jgi:hypothetical protein